MNAQELPEHIRNLERPHPSLWHYYFIRAILTGPALVVALPVLYFRYHTLRYRFDAEGIHMKVGLLFRREVNLTYSRIQDIHLRSGLLQRWLGLANVQIQTASGSSGPELVIEGFKEYEVIRDFLYTRMRGYQTRPGVGTAGGSTVAAATPPTIGGQAAAGVASAGDANGEVVSLLLSIRDELRRTRLSLEARNSAGTPAPLPAHPPANGHV